MVLYNGEQEKTQDEARGSEPDALISIVFRLIGLKNY